MEEAWSKLASWQGVKGKVGVKVGKGKEEEVLAVDDCDCDCDCDCDGRLATLEPDR